MSASVPAISVCVPMYNGERYLRQCIDSVLAQTYRDFELLLVDDCSTDATHSIAEQYVALDSRIRLITNPKNLGLVENWNSCIEHAKCRWIKFVFQDDMIHRDCLARMIAQAKNEILLIGCQRILLFEEGTAEYRRNDYLKHRRMIANLFAGQHFISPEQCQNVALDYFGINLFGEPTAMMIRRDAFERFGTFNPALLMVGDQEMWTRISINAGVALIPSDLATFRVHKDAVSALVHASREFRSNVLDNLVVLHEYAYSPAYKPVRDVARRRSIPIDLEKLFVQRCHEARAGAQWAYRHPTLGDPSLIAEWHDVAEKCPKIRGNGIAHLIWRVKRRLVPSLRSEPALDRQNYLKPAILPIAHHDVPSRKVE